MTTPHRGFTLLELLIALAIFSILSTMAYSGLRTVLDTRERMTIQANRIGQLQTAFLFFEKDLEQAVGRSARDVYGQAQAAMQGGQFGATALEFTRAGYRNPTGAARSQLQRVAYRIDEEKLIRVTWSMLDQPNTPKPLERELLTKVKKVTFRYLDGNGQWQDSWPPLSTSPTSTPNPAALSRLPQAVEITAEFEDMGKIVRWFRVPPGEAITKAKTPQGGGSGSGGSGGSGGAGSGGFINNPNSNNNQINDGAP